MQAWMRDWWEVGGFNRHSGGQRVMEIQETSTGKSHTCCLSSISFRAALPKLPGAQVQRQSTPSSRGEHTAVLDSGSEAGLSSSPDSLQSLSRGDTGHWDPAAQHSQPTSKSPARRKHGKDYFRLLIFKAGVRALRPSASPGLEASKGIPWPSTRPAPERDQNGRSAAQRARAAGKGAPRVGGGGFGVWGFKGSQKGW